MPIRVLHILGSLNRGGVETWLMHILRAVDHNRVKMDFLVHAEHPGAFDEEAKRLGAKIIVCPRPSRTFSYRRNLLNLIRSHGPYDVIHSHVAHYSGYILRAVAQGTNCERRIAHSHTDTSTLDQRAGWIRKAYLVLMKRWITAYATDGLGCSERAMSSLFGADWMHGKKRLVLPCGIDVSPFKQDANRKATLAELKLNENSIVIGHVGSFRQEKNHDQVLAVFAESLKSMPRAVLLLVGDGPERRRIEEQARTLGIRDRVHFGGARDDVAQLMISAMDVFLFPSKREGMPLVLIEAQAAGLPCVVSDVIPSDAEVLPTLIQRLSLDAPLEHWVCAVKKAATQPKLNKEGLEAIAKSAYTVSQSLASLYSVYEDKN